jgi:CO/xanthine dehydrogenase FAD-binding subunit
VRVRAAEAALEGGRPGAADWSQRVALAVRAVREFVQPITDVRASREWRRHVSGVLVERSIDHVADARNAGRTPRLEDGPTYCSGLRAS